MDLSNLDFLSIVFLGGLIVFILGIGGTVIPTDLPLISDLTSGLTANSPTLLIVGIGLMIAAIGLWIWKENQ